MESNRAESGQTRQGEQRRFLAFSQFRSFLGFMQYISSGSLLFLLRATGPERCNLQPKAFGTPTRPTLVLHVYTPWKSPDTTIASELCNFLFAPRQTCGSTTTLLRILPHYLAVNMLFYLLYAASGPWEIPSETE
jgi:hypothetical protein